MSNKTHKKFILNELITKWQQLQDTPNIFSYRLNVTESKYLPGKYRFYAELNPERTALRRAPQTILSLNPTFEKDKFNFTKINPQERIMNIPFGDSNTNVSMIINKSPLTRYHTLICPNVELGLPQRITLESLRFCVDFLLSLEDNQDFRIGYNSPGALASVNHLHLHLMFIDKELYIDQVKLTLHAQPHIYRLDETMPTEALCFIINQTDSLELREYKLDRLHQFLIWLCNNSVPHNLFMTPQKFTSTERSLKIFIFARQEYCIIKELNTYNIGFCELAGYVPVGTKFIYDDLTEVDILHKIKAETGNVFSKIYNYFNKK